MSSSSWVLSPEPELWCLVVALCAPIIVVMINMDTLRALNHVEKFESDGQWAVVQQIRISSEYDDYKIEDHHAGFEIKHSKHSIKHSIFNLKGDRHHNISKG